MSSGRTGSASPAPPAITCLVCGETAFDPLYATLLRCNSCGFVTADMASADIDPYALYGPGYFSGEEYIDYLGDKQVIQRNARRWLGIVRKYVPQGRLVELGSAYGFFLELAQRFFDVLGYDVSEEGVRHANDVLRVRARNKDFITDTEPAAGSVDVVAMWDVIEHLETPDRFVERSAELLREGGYLFLTTGDIESWLARRQRERWRLIHPPTHLHYFSPSSIGNLLRRVGFEVERISYPGYSRSIEQILYGLFRLGRAGEPGPVYRGLSKLLPQKMGVYVNTRDIMLVVARKTAQARSDA